MRIVLQQKATGLYFKDIGNWTPKSSDAMDFLSSTAAIEFCTTNQLAGVQLVLRFEEQHCDIVMPVLAAQPAYGDRLSDSV
ncbi:MAG: hypothetical protein DME25_00530 [Verrucomicrobia bacterium]|nr:MAG: hypothetical protein DME25_00530 [Verrucomicrobiota bacterium]